MRLFKIATICPKKQKSHFAFTLAEVLITLGVIGVIAAITIPILLQSTQEKELKTAWKKNFSVLTQATKLIMNENDNSMKEVTSTTNDDLRDAYLKYLKYTKKCDNGTAGCFWINSGDMTLLNGDPQPWVVDSSVILVDGTIIDFSSYFSNCTYSDGAINDVCGEIWLDVNGFKKPNVMGRDIFTIWIRPNQISPKGVPGDSFGSDCNTSDYGYGCAGKYLYE